MGKGYTYKSSGTNSQGNHYCSRDYGNGSNAYHYSNNNGSYYYQNPSGSTYYNNGAGGSTYTSPSGAKWSSGYGGKQQQWRRLRQLRKLREEPVKGPVTPGSDRLVIWREKKGPVVCESRPEQCDFTIENNSKTEQDRDESMRPSRRVFPFGREPTGSEQ
ncbi:hypothetical protein SPI_04581 [Niveomyces insectorum RCEF 264]|uniref:Uncharacterized protein n=1 Tax=Niveomyces insectorum RCEF 264 TaxID=1081102 RepID=A0A167UMQ8_9HYPO|nr:hypothetical protein SPI_04581 [Niveomyces insectorum RCEF 264]